MKRFEKLSDEIRGVEAFADLPNSKQRKFREVAWDVISKRQSFKPDQSQINSLKGPKQTQRETWQFEFSTESGAKHVLTFDPESSMWELPD